MQPSLLSQLDTRGVAPSEADRQQVVTAAQDLLRSNIALQALQRGERAPDVRVLDAGGAEVALGDALREGPLVLTFFRGRWCTFCQRFLGELQANAKAIDAAGARILAVSPQTPGEGRATREGLHLDFPVLSDPGNRAAAAFGLAYTLPEALRWAYGRLGIDLPRANGDDSFQLPVPATYVIQPDGRIAYAHVDPDHTNRPDPAEIVAALGDDRPARGLIGRNARVRVGRR